MLKTEWFKQVDSAYTPTCRRRLQDNDSFQSASIRLIYIVISLRSGPTRPFTTWAAQGCHQSTWTAIGADTARPCPRRPSRSRP